MSGFYVGVDGKARKIKGGYIGIDGVARKIKKGYIGVDGVARLCWIDNPFDPVFANNTWEEIAIACQTGNVPDSWAVGDQKTMTINGANYTIDIIGKYHDDYADGSGKAPLTFQLHDCYNTIYKMNSSGTNSGGWTNCAMRTSNLASFVTLMPTEVQNGIKEVNKLTSAGYASTTINTTADKLFLLSEIEVFGKLKCTCEGEGTQYAYYAAGNSACKTLNGIANVWWTRSPYATNTIQFAVVKSDGTASDSSNANTARGLAFAFCF